MDKVERCGIRVCDLIKPEVFREKLRENIDSKNDIIVKVYNGEPLNFDEIYEEYVELGKKLKPFVRDISVRVHDEIKKGKKVLLNSFTNRKK